MPKQEFGSESDRDDFYREEMLTNSLKENKDYIDSRDKLAEDAVEALKNQFRTPKDLSGMSIEDQSNLLSLHFIGYFAKPTGITDELYNKCIEAFNSHRGKVEWEQEAILKVLKGEV